MIRSVQVCTAGECGGECYRCQLRDAHSSIDQLKDVLRLAYHSLAEGDVKQKIREVLKGDTDQ